jgi:hypothetical protein
MSLRFLPAKLSYRSRKAAKDIPKYVREFEGHKGRNWGAKIEQECTKSDSRALSLVYIAVLHDLFHQSD